MLWFVTGLPVPSTYTVTFSGPGLANQTRSVDVDPLTGANVTDVDATLTRANGSITGKVELRSSNPGDPLVPAGGATVTASGGGLTFTTRTATVPTDLAFIGTYVLPDVPAGTYTVTFSFPGRAPVTTLRTIAAGQDLVGVDGVLEPLGSIRVLVCLVLLDGADPPSCESGSGVVGAEVRLYRRSLYPQPPPEDIQFSGPDNPETPQDETGIATFADLFGPEDYIIEVYVSGVLQTPTLEQRLNPGEDVIVGYEL